MMTDPNVAAPAIAPAATVQRPPPPALRTQPVATATWGDLVVHQLLSSERIRLSARDLLRRRAALAGLDGDAARIAEQVIDQPLPADASPEDPAAVARYADDLTRGVLWTSELLAATVRGRDGKPMYDATGWDAWASAAQDDVARLADAALAINGFQVFSKATAQMESAAKND